jgi:GMP synthase-like glutamine amidotransferase
LPTHPKVFHWHEDTFDLPAQAVLLATNSDTINQAFRYGRRAYGLQFHIEVDQTIFHDWLYQSSLDPNILQASGLSTHRPTLEKEWRDQLPIYQKHTTILLENFLALSHLIA